MQPYRFDRRIHLLKVFYNEPFRRDSSFQIIVQSTTSFALQNLQGQALPFNMEAMRQYLRYFMNIQYERLITSANLKREVNQFRFF